MATIDISKMDKAEVLIALYNNAKPQGMGFLHYDPTPMEKVEAIQLLKQEYYFDYYKGRVMKIDLSSDELWTDMYNCDNGPNAAEKALAHLK